MRSVSTRTSRIPEEIGNLIASPQAYARQKQLLSAFRGLRESNPVGRVELEDFDPFWAVTRCADIVAVSRQHEIFHNGDRATALVPRATDEKVRALMRGSPHLIRTPVHMDAPEHPAYRAITQSWFTRQSVSTLEDRIRGVARHCLDRMSALGSECEFVHDVVRPFPLRVMLSILGIPQDDAPEVLALTEKFFQGQDEIDIADKASAKDPARHAKHLFHVLSEFRTYFKPLIEARLKAPRDDVITAIAHAKIDGTSIRSFEAISYLLILATAGHHTTSSSIAGGVWALCQHPNEFRKVAADRDLIPNLAEEAIRWTTPVQHFMRTAARDTELNGQRIAAGDWLMLCYLSGSRDEAVFDNPDCFCVDRSSEAAIAFGHGAHICLGRHLARLEMRIFFEEMFARIDRIELNGEPRRCASVFVGGPTYVPVRYNIVAA
ncbi:cytochrome P450 [Bradyrhizobium sp. G127]|jgi:cytochrome P450|uniref:cytochrome P450 n=1 Tax=Bradyrhizobium sp. G127 TaxID=2904800 RepID=UPI001F30C0D9|nr:cytochrome P450 [Bradyrhizobium sp. G127]MCF2524752.1 cytochrome P450 [Bradyrhizobium sp. G127]